MDRARALLAAPDDRTRALRVVGGLLLGVGMLIVFIRRDSEFADPWGGGALFLVLLAPCAFLYGAGLLAALDADEPPAWSAVYLIFGALLVAPTLFQLLEWLGGDTDAPLNIAWIALLTGLAGAIAALRAGVRVGMLLAGLALVVAWMALWDELLADGAFDDLDTTRLLLVIVGAILGAVGFAVGALGRSERHGWSELVTAGGLAAVIGTGGLIVSQGLMPVPVTPTGDPAEASVGVEEASLFWDLFLGVLAVALILWGSRAGHRGPTYVGGIGLALFALIVGLDLDDSSPAGKLLGWPLIVLVLGAGAFVASLLANRGSTAAPRTSAPRDSS